MGHLQGIFTWCPGIPSATRPWLPIAVVCLTLCFLLAPAFSFFHHCFLDGPPDEVQSALYTCRLHVHRVNQQSIKNIRKKICVCIEHIQNFSLVIIS
jgi:hypothetical protein